MSGFSEKLSELLNYPEQVRPPGLRDGAGKSSPAFTAFMKMHGVVGECCFGHVDWLGSKEL